MRGDEADLCAIGSKPPAVNNVNNNVNKVVSPPDNVSNISYSVSDYNMYLDDQRSVDKSTLPLVDHIDPNLIINNMEKKYYGNFIHIAKYDPPMTPPVLPDSFHDSRWTLMLLIQYFLSSDHFHFMFFIKSFFLFLWKKVSSCIGWPFLVIDLFYPSLMVKLSDCVSFLRQNFKSRKKKFIKKCKARWGKKKVSFPHGIDLFEFSKMDSIKNLPLHIHNLNALDRSVVGGPRLSSRRVRTLIRSKKWERVSVQNGSNPTLKEYDLVHIEGLPCLPGVINGVQHHFLVDSGCFFNVISSNNLEQIESNGDVRLARFDNNTSLNAHNDTPLHIEKQGVKLPILFTDSQGESRYFELPFLVERTNEQRFTLLGYSSLKNRHLVLDAGRGIISCELQEGKNILTPSSDMEYSSLPRESGWFSGNVHFWVPALKDFTGQGIISPLGSCCNVKHAPEISCLKAQRLSNSLDQTLNGPLPFSPLAEGHFLKETLVVSISKGSFTLHYPMVTHFSSYMPFSNCKIVCKKGSSQKSTWPVLPDCEDLVSHDSLQHAVHAALRAERKDLLDIFKSQQVGPGTIKMLPLDVENHAVDATILCLKGSLCLLCSSPCSCASRAEWDPALSDNVTSGWIRSDTYQIYFPPNDKSHMIESIMKAGESAIFVKFLDEILSQDMIKFRLGSGPNLSSNGNEFKNIFNFVLNETLGAQGKTFYLGPGSPSINVVVERPDPKPDQPPLPPREVVKHPSLLDEAVGVPPRILDPEGVEFTSGAEHFSVDFKALMKNSDAAMEGFIYNALKAFPGAVSQGPTDVGCLRHPDFELDLELKSNSESLPKHKPFPTSLASKKACSRIISLWVKSGIAQPSKVTSHCSRLVVVKKQIGPSDLISLASRLELENNVIISRTDPQAAYQVEPDLLSDKEISKLYRVVLDATDLNLICKEEAQVQQSTEVCLHDLSIALGDKCTLPGDHSFRKDNIEVVEGGIPYQNEYITLLEKEIAEMGPEEDNILYVSNIDVRSAHNILPCSLRAQFLLNFITPSFELLKFVRGAFGLKKVGTKFNSSLIRILSDLIDLQVIFIYSDDILIVMRGRKNHCKLLIEVLRRFHDQGVKISLNKCEFFVQDFRHLGFRFNQEGIHLTDERVRALTSFATPTCLKNLQMYLGNLVYIRRFYPLLNYDTYALTEAVRISNKTKKFFWGPDQERAFAKTKEVVKKGLSLNYVPGDKKLSLFCDASSLAGGGALFIGDPSDPEFKPVAFFSRKFSDHEVRLYSALEKEAINILDTLEKLSYYIDSNISLDIYTDAKALCWILYASKRSTNQKLARICAKLAQYPANFRLSYISPKHEGMILVDSLSRQFDREHNDGDHVPIGSLREISKKDVNISIEGDFTFNQLCDLVDEGKHVEIELPEVLARKSPLQRGDCIPPLPKSAKLNMHHNYLVSKELATPNVILEQEKFQFSRDLRRAILDGSNLVEVDKKVVKGYFMKDGVLLKLVDLNGELSESNSRVFLPPSLVNAVICLYHILWGHLGGINLSKILMQKYFATKFRAQIIDFCRRCHLCLMNRISTLRKTPITGFNFATKPMEIISLDFFAMNHVKGFKAVLVVIDHYSAFTFCFACRNEKAQTVKIHLQTLFKFFGTPSVLKSDNGTGLLRSKVIKRLMQQYNIRRVSLNAPYAPYHNSLCERQVKTLRGIFRMEVINKDLNWPDILPQVNLIKNMIPRVFNNDLMASPFEMFFNRRPEPFMVSPESLLKNLSSAYGDDAADIKAITKKIQGEIKKLKQHYMDDHNKKSGSRVKTGDLVVIKNMALGDNAKKIGKQGLQYKPILYLCTGVNGTIVMVQNIANNVTLMVHSDHIKKYAERGEYFDSLPEELRLRVGGSFLLNLGNEDRNVILQKLKLAGFETNPGVENVPVISKTAVEYSVRSGPLSETSKLRPPLSSDGSQEAKSVTSMSSARSESPTITAEVATPSNSSIYGRVKRRLRNLGRKNYKV